MAAEDPAHPHRPDSQSMRRLGASLRALNANADEGNQTADTNLGCGFTMNIISDVTMTLPTTIANKLMAIDAIATAGRFTADWPDEHAEQLIEIDRNHNLANQLTGAAAALKAMVDDIAPVVSIDPDPRDKLLDDLTAACCADPQAVRYVAIQRTLRMPNPPSNLVEQAQLASAWLHHFIVGRQVAIGLP